MGDIISLKVMLIPLAIAAAPPKTSVILAMVNSRTSVTHFQWAGRGLFYQAGFIGPVSSGWDRRDGAGDFRLHRANRIH